MLRRAGAGCSKRNFGDKTDGDNERPRASGFVGVLPRRSGSVRPWAAAVGAPGGNAGGCREFKFMFSAGFEFAATVFTATVATAAVATAAVWSWGPWPPECVPRQTVPASSLPDEAVW